MMCNWQLKKIIITSQTHLQKDIGKSKASIKSMILKLSCQKII